MLRILSMAISLVCVFGFSCTVCAQRTKTPTLEEILQRLQLNLNHYESRLPSLFCEEHVVSRVEPGSRNEDILTDSIFRLKRTQNPDHTTTLAELREIKSVNGKPPTSQDIDGPTLLSGVFDGGLSVVSLNQSSCINYSVQRSNKSHPADLYVVRFATVLTPQNSADCVLQEKSKGRVFIDPVSMQIKRLELTTPQHTILAENSYTSAVMGKRDLTVDYTPVLLGEETFWMPSTITMRNTSGSGTFHMVVWSFRATYRDYHLTEVTSHITYGGKTLTP